MRRCPTKKPVAMKRGGSATVKNPVAKAVKKIKPSIVKPKKGKGSYNRKASSFSSGGAAKVRSAGKDYMAGIRKRTPETGVKAKSRQQAMKEKIQKDANKSRRGFDAKPRQLEELKSGGNVKKKVGKVVKALKKASKSHAGQAKTLSALKLREGGSTTKRKPKVKTPKGTKGFKGIQPLKPTPMRASRYESGGKMKPPPLPPRKKGISEVPEDFMGTRQIEDNVANKRKRKRGSAKTSLPTGMKKGGKTKSRVNEAGNYTKPALRKRIFNRIKAGGKGGAPGQWSARKAQMMAQAYKKAGGGYRD